MTWEEWLLNPTLIFRTLFHFGWPRVPEASVPLNVLNTLPNLPEPGKLSEITPVPPGLEIPPVLWAGVLGILFLFGIAVYFYCVQNIGILRTLERTLIGLRKAPSDVKGIESVLSREEVLAPVWSEAQGHLIDNKQGRGERQLFLVGEWSEHFKLESILKRESAYGFFALVPSTLTGLGLLFTFIAILDGLSSVRVSEDLQVAGLSGLINGLSGKFLTSIVALASAILFTVLDRVIQTLLERRWEGLLSTLRTKIPERSIAMLWMEQR